MVVKEFIEIRGRKVRRGGRILKNSPRVPATDIAEHGILGKRGTGTQDRGMGTGRKRN